ncbi:anion-transporting ATPase [Pyrolobus fumarii 1A]|uniref:Anion-transporting ATPase n=1 Tax=Pyrolobus fumarii (strain DSM 11204 / 1A) TaxID=694429 RepID=G0EDF3_PYRF1|nr:ArsA-related P-loop ATPase [Pyrolobus fumarii]AEM38638.1 anion-transporting ATPase [Pyrolobus fumarii 1A]
MGSTLEAEAGAESPAHRPLLVSLWGKGGVGKSTLAAALAISLRKRGLNVGLISTDIFPSIIDVLGTGKPGEWFEACGVQVLAVSKELASRMWRERFGDEIYKVFSLLFDVDKETLLSYLEEAPWILEQVYLMMVVEGLKRFDAVVWDTPGAGGGLLMLELEEKLYRHLRLAPRIYSKLRIGGHEPIDKIIKSWRKLAEEILQTIHSETHVPIVVVDAFGGEWQVREILHALESYNLKPKAIIVNRVVTGEVCQSCKPFSILAGIASGTLQVTKEIAISRGMEISTVPLVVPPPKGCKMLDKLSSLFGNINVLR